LLFCTRKTLFDMPPKRLRINDSSDDEAPVGASTGPNQSKGGKGKAHQLAKLSTSSDIVNVTSTDDDDEQGSREKEKTIGKKCNK
jgi:hypothetical protein